MIEPVALNATHDPALRSWVPSANSAGTDFPIQNLPFAAIRRAGSGETFRAGVAIGDEVLDLGALHTLAPFTGIAAQALAACAAPALNALMGQGAAAAAALRAAISAGLRAGAAQERAWRSLLVPRSATEYRVPADIGDFTDFYASIHHATAVGRLMRPDNPLLPNYKWMPIAYHGRASSVRVSGFAFRRPRGQLLPKGVTAPFLGPSRRLDYELEMGIFVGRPNELGTSVSLARAEAHVFGLCLLNDWSARDIQGWEYQPLGPFLAKNFLSSISPWVVTLEALAPFRCAVPRTAGDPKTLPYLAGTDSLAQGGLDLQVEDWIETPKSSGEPMRISRSSSRHSYWGLGQMVTHHTGNGCNLKPGDLLGTGTLSGPGEREQGCLMELSQGGREPLRLQNGETRVALEDGDTIILRAWAEREGFRSIGLGECRGTVLPALVA